MFALSKNVEEEKRAQEVLSKLKFISQIQPNEKINVHDLTLANDSIYCNFWRYYHGESRSSTLLFIEELLIEAIDMAEVYLFQEDEFKRKLACIILETMEETKSGVQNLCKTYGCDRMFTSKLNILTKTLEVKTLTLKKRAKDSIATGKSLKEKE